MFQIIFNNTFIRLNILNNIARNTDLFNLMSTSSSNQRLVKKSLENMTIEIKYSTVKLTNGTLSSPINQINNISHVYRLKIINPIVSCLHLLKQVEILELVNWNTNSFGIQLSEEIIDHLKKIVKSKLILTNGHIKESIYAQLTPLMKKDHLSTLDMEYLKDPKSHLLTLDWSNVQSISFQGKVVNDELLKKLSESSASGLINVTLNECDLVTDMGISYFIKSVKKLSVSDLNNISDKSLELAEANLESLCISGCSGVRGVCYKKLCKTLRLLDVHYSVDTLWAMGDCDPYEYLIQIPNIHVVINTRNIKHPKHRKMENCYRYLSLITKVEFVDSYIMTDDIWSNLTRLKEIYFQQGGGNTFKGYSDIGIKNFIENRLPNAGQIEFLSLDSCILTDQSLKLLQGKVRHLELYLDIKDEWMKYLDGVEKLDLNCSELLTDEGMKSLSNVLSLGLYCCPLVTEKGFSYLNNIKELKILDYFPLEAVKYLENLDTLIIFSWEKEPIPHELAKHLHRLLTIIDLNYSTFFSNDSIQFLVNNGVHFEYCWHSGYYSPKFY
ncbi:hypothetical protein DLAC_01617 [Tieghemostelium lacteum]|uniref:Uncharacterized protein n=1 Tax=Tieghemostelium lacteum TaxID=361077 RepID=A0A152A6D7_TIELA|nr:hypothetical protein DLAC_01617 [Tieghemostelium lacteum]|eukprot:KYR01617.1 hypothetical protein DLAC_01617 [Tieghemostelium lacteum]